MSNKVIIITRSTAYTEDMPDSQKVFYSSIKAQSQCEYNKKNRLKKFIVAREEWNCKRQFSNSDIGAYKKLFDGEMPENLGGAAIKKIPTKAILRLMDEKELEYDSIQPYASFMNINSNEEVVLVLTDRINVKRNEFVAPFELFIDSIFKDVLLDDDEVILFVHDGQIDKSGDSKKLDIRDFIKDEILTDRIIRFYCFSHYSESPSIFQDIILKLKIN